MLGADNTNFVLGLGFSLGSLFTQALWAVTSGSAGVAAVGANTASLFLATLTVWVYILVNEAPEYI